MYCMGLMFGPSFKLLAVKPGSKLTKYLFKLLLGDVYGTGESLIAIYNPSWVRLACSFSLMQLEFLLIS